MKKKWWHDKIAYQIYPKSFQDSNGDGIGDIRGIIQRLDYIRDLGIDILWISPIYVSPMVDNGYDIADYYGIDPVFGTMEDIELLIEEAKKRNIHILLDLVINHCSDQHRWFQEALRDPDGPYGKFFYIMNGKDGKEPNNWRSYFGGSVWEKLPGQEDRYYLHFFAKEQPDLNWENPQLREEIYAMVNWWLDKGIAGFRIDAIINIKKDLTWQDVEADGPDGMGMVRKSIQRATGIGVFLKELKERCFEPHDAFTVGEVFEVEGDELEEFIGDNGYFSTMFDFKPSHLNHGDGWYEYRDVPFTEWRDCIFETQEQAVGRFFEANILENHDQPRGASAYIPPEDYGFYSVTALATLSVLLRGIPFLYQGQEIGMTNCLMDSVESYNDIGTIDYYYHLLNQGLSEQEALLLCEQESRDNTRTPMQWSDQKNAGFTQGIPWMPVNPNYVWLNVDAQKKEYGSILNFYKRLLAFRKSEEYVNVFTYGDFIPAYQEKENIFAYYRTSSQQKIMVICNYSGSQIKIEIAEEYENVIFVNYDTLTRVGNVLHLQPYQTIVVEMT